MPFDKIDIFTLFLMGILLVGFPIEAAKVLEVDPQAGQALAFLFSGLLISIFFWRYFLKNAKEL